MYGMIHRAARTMSIEVLGEATWTALSAEAGFDEGDFLSAHVYPDERTLALVGVIAAKAGLSVADTLHAFGHFWIKYASESAYGPIMRLNGETLSEFLANLDRMHATIQRVMPETRMPSFHVASSSAHHIDVLYQSDRRGLEPFVAGLLEGLMKRFNQPGGLSHAPDADGVLFTITLADAAAVAA